MKRRKQPVRVSELHAGNAEREQRHAGVYPRCSDWCFDRKMLHSTMPVDKSSCLTGLCFDSAHRFQRTEVLLFFFPLSFFGGWGRSASAVSFTLSLPSLRFLLIPVAASVQIIAPRHVHRLRWESCCLLYLWNSEKHAGPAGQQHEIYIMWKIQGEFSCYTSLFRHLSEKKKSSGLKNGYFCSFHGLEVKKSYLVFILISVRWWYTFGKCANY